MNFKKIMKYLPSYPHYKMNVFSGTNCFSEIIEILKRICLSITLTKQATKQYEIAIQKKINSKNIFTFASGRMGFYSILKTINIQSNEEVIIPSFTCVVVSNAILYSGAIPIYCDIKSDDFNIDISKIEALITPQTRVIYAQHTFGQMCDIEGIMDIAKKYNLIVIEDAALSLGAIFQGKYAGTIADFGYYSTDRSKVINTGLGGIVSVNNDIFVAPFDAYYKNVPYLDEKMSRKIAFTFVMNYLTLNPLIYWIGKFLNIVLFKIGILEYFLDEKIIKKEQIRKYPYPARFPSILISLGISQINSLDDNIKHRREIAKFYNDILKIYTEDYIKNNKNIFLRYSFLVQNRDYWETRFSSCIDLSIWFKTIASGRNEKFEDIYYICGTNLISETVCKYIFNLPTHNQIRTDKLKKLLEELKDSGDIITQRGIL